MGVKTVLETRKMKNRYQAIAAAHGDTTAYKFWKRIGGSQGSAYRVFNDPEAYPSQEVLTRVYRSYGASPSEQLVLDREPACC